MSAAIDYSETKNRLLVAPRLTNANRKKWVRGQGAYAFWFDSTPPVCLKVGIALRQRKNGEDRSVYGRLSNHFNSNPDNSVLARHLAADSGSSWASGFNFTDRKDRQRFLAERCYVRALEITKVNRQELEAFEDYLEDELQPIYRGNVTKR